MKRKRILSLLVLSLFLIKSYAQLDLNFFNLNVANPAVVGSKENFSVGVEYSLNRVDLEFIDINRFSGAPQSFIANVYTPITAKLGVGISYINSKVGSSKENLLNADASYKFNLNENSNLSLGLKTGFSTSNLGRFELSGPLGEPIELITLKETSFNLGFGAYYFADEFSVGASIPNLLQKRIQIGTNDGEVGLVDVPSNIVLSSAYKTNLSNNIEFSPAALIIFNADIDTQYYISANFNFKNIIGIGFNYQEDIFGIQLTSPEIFKIVRVGFNIGFIDTEFDTPFNNNIDFFGNFDFNPISPNNTADNLPAN